MNRLLSFWRLPGGTGLAIAVVTVPLILLLPDIRLLVVLAALCLYPVLDVPRILARPSWWRGAAISAIVWFVAFAVLTGIADSVRRLGEDAMILLLPFMMYPIGLVLSGIVRLEGRLRGRPRESGPRIATIVIGVACGLMVIVPAALNMIPVVIEKTTGNTPPNVVYSGDGEVLASDAEHVSVRVAGKPESFRVTSETKFDFRGPGPRQVSGAAGPEWLKAGQRVGLEYVYRGGEAQARAVNIWIERKGCAGDAKWTAAAQAPASSASSFPSLAGTTWEGWIGSRDEKGRRDETTFEFLADSRLAYQGAGGTRNTDGLWRQNGAAVLIEVNDCYAEYEGQIAGDEIKGQFSNEMGVRANWTARKKQTSQPDSGLKK